MPSDSRSISDVRLTRATAAERRAGLVGWLRFSQGVYEYDGVRLCRTADGGVSAVIAQLRERGDLS